MVGSQGVQGSRWWWSRGLWGSSGVGGPMGGRGGDLGVVGVQG